MKDIIESWDEEQGIAYCLINDNGKIYSGYATCHPDDKDMQSKLVGQTIAVTRAEIDALTKHRDNELKPGLASLKQLYYSINKSKKYNKDSYEARMLYRHIRMMEEDIKTINELIKKTKEELRTYIAQKEDLYKSIRKGRK